MRKLASIQTVNAVEPILNADESNVLVRISKGLRLEEKLKAARDRLGFDVAIQAEVVGPGIQKNKYSLPGSSTTNKSRANGCSALARFEIGRALL